MLAKLGGGPDRLPPVLRGKTVTWSRSAGGATYTNIARPRYDDSGAIVGVTMVLTASMAKALLEDG